MDRTDKQLAQFLLSIAHHRQHDPKAIEQALKDYGLTADEIARGTTYLTSSQPILGR